MSIKPQLWIFGLELDTAEDVRRLIMGTGTQSFTEDEREVLYPSYIYNFIDL